MRLELTRFGGHPDTWDRESRKEVCDAYKFTPEYPPELRAEAVRLVRDGGRTISAAPRTNFCHSEFSTGKLAGMDGNRTHPGRVIGAPQTVLKTAGGTSRRTSPNES